MLRVGSVPYWVGRPLDLGLGDEPGLELLHDVPARLVAGLRGGTLDVALVSSIELFRRPGYGYLDGPVVAGEGHVSSVQVFLRRPAAEVASVALDPASRTAAALTQVVWPAGPRPRFLEVPVGADPRAAAADAWLRIGDRALEESWVSARGRERLNPSAAWRAATGLPFVFAAWIVRPGADRALVERHAPAFERARRRGLARLGALAEEAARELGLPPDELRRYLGEECAYDVGARLAPALAAFRDRAAALGLAQAGLEPEPIPARERG